MKLKSEHIAGLTAILVVGLWIANWLIVPMLFCDASSQGQFGDRFGATNALFSGFTIIGLIYTIFLQREDLRIARDSFHQQQQELILSRQESKQQNRTLKLQRFETTFFNMVNLHMEIVSRWSNKTDTFNHILETVKDQTKDISEKGALISKYQSGVSSFVRTRLDQYISNLETLIDIIDKEKKTAKGKEKYFKILFAQITPIEKTILLYHFNLRGNSLPLNFDSYKHIAFKGVDEISNYHKGLLLGNE